MPFVSANVMGGKVNSKNRATVHCSFSVTPGTSGLINLKRLAECDGHILSSIHLEHGPLKTAVA